MSTDREAPKPKRVLIVANSNVATLLAMAEKITTLPTIDILEAAGDPGKEAELLRRMDKNIRRECR